MNRNNYLPLYDYLDSVSEPNTIEEISSVSYSNMLDDISIALMNYRYDKKINQKQLAKELSCSQSLISAYESGARNISIEKLCELMAKINKKVTISIEDVDTFVDKQPCNNLYPDSELETESENYMAG